MGRPTVVRDDLHGGLWCDSFIDLSCCPWACSTGKVVLENLRVLVSVPSAEHSFGLARSNRCNRSLPSPCSRLVRKPLGVSGLLLAGSSIHNWFNLARGIGRVFPKYIREHSFDPGDLDRTWLHDNQGN